MLEVFGRVLQDLAPRVGVGSQFDRLASGLQSPLPRGDGGNEESTPDRRFLRPSGQLLQVGVLFREEQRQGEVHFQLVKALARAKLPPSLAVLFHRLVQPVPGA